MVGAVGPLGAIDQRAALQGDAPAIRLDRVVGDDAAHRHRQRQLNHVAALPDAAQLDVASIHIQCDGLAIDLEHNRLADAIGKAVEVARHGFVARPAGDADVDRQRAGAVGRDGHAHVAGPGVARLLRQAQRAAIVELDRRRACDKEIDVERVALLCVHVAGHGGEEARHVSGAAGDAEPRAALVLAVTFERVGVEERLAVERDARQQPVVKRPLHHVNVAGVLVQQEQPVVPVVVADGRASLVVSRHVRQVVVSAEAFDVADRADAARDVELLVDDVAPDSVNRVNVRIITRQRRDVGHAGIHVRRAHRMADGFGLVSDFGVRLVVLAPAALRAVRAARVEQELRQAKVTRVAALAVELRQRHLGDLVAGPNALLAGAERAVEQVCALDRDVEQRALAGGLIVSHGGFREVADLVQFVAVLALQFPAPRARPRVRLFGVDRARRVEVAVTLLRRGDLRDQAVNVSFELGVRLHAERVGRALDDLVDVRVVERVDRQLLVTVRLAADGGGGALKVGDAPRFFTLLEGEGDGNAAVDVDARRPELIVEVYGGERHGLDRIIARRLVRFLPPARGGLRVICGSGGATDCQRQEGGTRSLEFHDRSRLQ